MCHEPDLHVLDQLAQLAHALCELGLRALDLGDVGGDAAGARRLRLVARGEVAPDAEHHVRLPLVPDERALNLHHQAAPVLGA